jgi:hypothetical protein
MLIQEEEQLDNQDEATIFNKKMFQVKGIDCDIRIAKNIIRSTRKIPWNKTAL